MYVLHLCTCTVRSDPQTIFWGFYLAFYHYVPSEPQNLYTGGAFAVSPWLVSHHAHAAASQEDRQEADAQIQAPPERRVRQGGRELAPPQGH